MGIIWEDSFLVFFFLTLLLGGGAAWRSGRAIALDWKPWWHAALWMLLLAAATRFLKYALFNGTLLSLHFYLVDAACLIAMAALGHRVTRARRMQHQYGWLFERTSPVTWRRLASGGMPPHGGEDAKEA